MEFAQIDQSNASAIDRISRDCGDVTVGCSDVAGIVQAVIDSSERLRAEHNALKDTVAALEEDERHIADACDESRLLSHRASERLSEGTRLIHGSLRQVTNLLDLVDTLTQHVTGFASAMQQVRRSSLDIGNIAETTNILSFNASIEAARAGEAGRSFAVVANEVKNLAGQTRKATDEITRTIDALDKEAANVVARIQEGAKASAEAKTSVARIAHTIDGVSGLVSEVDGQNDTIARSNDTINRHVVSIRQVLESFEGAAIANEDQLHRAHRRMEDLEMTASAMFDALVHAGLSPQDSAMVERAQVAAQEIADAVDKGLSSGDLDISSLFDREYREIPGSNPKRYSNSLVDWANHHWRPIFDSIAASDPQIMAAACTDMSGFLPTHLTQYSREPIGDVVHDTGFCRNGRIIFDPIDQKAKRSTAPFMMAVYRQEGDGQSYKVVRNVYLPLFLAGRRWGDLELAYSFD